MVYRPGRVYRALFTALSNGSVSAILAFSRSFVFMVAAMLTLPALLGVTGVWLATPVAEALALLLSMFMLTRYQCRYGYSLRAVPAGAEG